MGEELEELAAFTHAVLVPRACEVLGRKYEDYCNGVDIGVAVKSDATPASEADRETEEALRTLIEEAYPAHGIWGEELGATGIDREYVWVLDPLDGTKEFLAKKPGCFGTLIGLLRKGIPVFGAISDPLSGTDWSGTSRKAMRQAAEARELAECTAACTNPESMFPTPAERALINAVEKATGEFVTALNCIGFAAVAEGSIDVAVESGLGLHDIVALIPVLQSAGCTVMDFNGNDYAGRTFDLTGAVNRKYDMIAAGSPALAGSVLTIINKARGMI